MLRFFFCSDIKKFEKDFLICDLFVEEIVELFFEIYCKKKQTFHTVNVDRASNEVIKGYNTYELLYRNKAFVIKVFVNGSIEIKIKNVYEQVRYPRVLKRKLRYKIVAQKCLPFTGFRDSCNKILKMNINTQK